MSIEESLASLGLSDGDPEEIFDIHSREGAGAFGRVFRASYRTSRKEAALKVIPIALKPGQYGEDVDNVRREIEFLRECNHPNVVAFYGAYYKDGALWIAMEYCGGGSVGDISRQRKLCEQEISVIMRGALEGLAHLHSKKKIHRDIKGGNILLTAEGYVKIADFGVSAQLRDTLSRRGTFVGTPYWMSPEMIQDCNYDYKADIWSLGITAIELADQRPPLFDEHPMRVLIQIPRNPAPRLKQPQDWSAHFSNFLQYCLTKAPAERPSAIDCLLHPFITCWRDIPRVVPGGVVRSRGSIVDLPRPIDPRSMTTITEVSTSALSSQSTLDELILAAKECVDSSGTTRDTEASYCDVEEDALSISASIVEDLVARVERSEETLNVESAVSTVNDLDDLIKLAKSSSLTDAEELDEEPNPEISFHHSNVTDDDELPHMIEIVSQPETEPAELIKIRQINSADSDLIHPKRESVPTTFIGTPFEVSHPICVKYNSYDAKYEGVPANFQQLHQQFGIPLAQMRSSSKRPDDHVPALLRMLRRELGEGIKAKYIYRSSPDHAQIIAAKAEINIGKFDPLSKRGEPYLLSSLIKAWFRDLPELLLSRCPLDSFIPIIQQAKKVPGSHDVIITSDQTSLDTSVETFLKPLDACSRQIFEWLLEHWYEVVKSHKNNMMSAHSLAIVWVPNLIQLPLESPQEASVVSNQVAMALQVCMLWWQRKNKVVETTESPVDSALNPKDSLFPTPSEPIPLCIDGRLFHVRECLVRVLQVEIDRIMRERRSFSDCQRQVLNLLRQHARSRSEREYAEKLLQNPSSKTTIRPSSLTDCGRIIDIALEPSIFAEFEAEQINISSQLNQLLLKYPQLMLTPKLATSRPLVLPPLGRKPL
ncbi:hypothetical protein Ae201684_003512 [Aphanomyces euteiches]|uniref:Protein kinase domain-containing protein n=1 Tax=Aphanomyces euteiches TaxID=100861 RepID=A0A6G0XM00_9STRA|nr:hypothetical protein Ae201684_003512 [Aphanomyces euteiches]KAH9145347.1 hypothetical protein AeRB84_010700 [Aphanomyces euteiches]